MIDAQTGIAPIGVTEEIPERVDPLCGVESAQGVRPTLLQAGRRLRASGANSASPSSSAMSGPVVDDASELGWCVETEGLPGLARLRCRASDAPSLSNHSDYLKAGGDHGILYDGPRRGQAYPLSRMKRSCAQVICQEWKPGRHHPVWLANKAIRALKQAREAHWFRLLYEPVTASPGPRRSQQRDPRRRIRVRLKPCLCRRIIRQTKCGR